MKIENINLKQYNNLPKEDVIVAEKSDYEVIPEGVYVGEYLGAEKRVSETGEYYLHSWGVKLKNGKDAVITELSSLKLTEKTKLGGIFEALNIEIIRGNEYRLSSLIGHKCQLVVKNETEQLKNGDKIERNRIKEHLRV